MISHNSSDYYYGSIDIEISPEDEVLFNFELDNIPDVVNICYCDVTDIIDLFNSYEGGYVLQKAMNNEISLTIFPTDSLEITKEEKKYLIGHEVLFRKKNIKFYQTWYDSNINFEFYLGCTIHSALNTFIEQFRNETFDYTKKENHFLTLNNLHTPDRQLLFDFYDKLNDDDKEKFLCSFRFAGVILDKNLPEILNEYDLIFRKQSVNHYSNSLIEIVSESSYSAITEKTYKPLLIGIPFIHWIFNPSNEVHYQIEFLNSIGIDSCYFGINYSNKQNVVEKVKELLSLTPEEIRIKYKSDFEKAKENKIKIYSWIDNISKNILK